MCFCVPATASLDSLLDAHPVADVRGCGVVLTWWIICTFFEPPTPLQNTAERFLTCRPRAQVYVVEAQGKEGPKVQSDGVNFEGAWHHSDIADVNAVTTNDVYAMLVTYGVEAARATIMREVQSVFAAYGIGVDPRHLSLIADFMTHQVGCKTMTGLQNCENTKRIISHCMSRMLHGKGIWLLCVRLGRWPLTCPGVLGTRRCADQQCVSFWACR